MAEINVLPKTRFVKGQVDPSVATAMNERQFNVAAGLTAPSYDFTELSYELTNPTINNVARKVWRIYDKNGKSVAASAFFAHDEQGVNFSGLEAGVTNILGLCDWLDGKILTKTEKSANIYGAKFSATGALEGRNVKLDETRFYYEVKQA